MLPVSDPIHTFVAVSVDSVTLSGIREHARAGSQERLSKRRVIGTQREVAPSSAGLLARRIAKLHAGVGLR